MKTTHYFEQRKRHREKQRQDKSDDSQGLSIPYSNMPTATAPYNFTDSSLPTALPVYCPVLSRLADPPKTPPSIASSSLRLENENTNPTPPPNPLRLAGTNSMQHLPRPDVSPFYYRSFPPPTGICFEYVGHPSLRVFRVKLPRHLVDGPLDAIVRAAEKHAESLPSGWRTELYSLTKCDIACKDIPDISAYVKSVSMYIYLAIQILYGCPSVTVDHNQPHILKYSAEDGYTGVELHHDRCDITANLALSRSNTYIGGGTFIAAINRVIRLEQGEFLLHPGCLVHGGNPITAGTRYLLVTFADLR